MRDFDRVVLKKILVTGANGFLGRAVCAELLEKGFEVLCAVRSRFLLDGARIIRIPDLEREHDWSSNLDGVDCIIHAAGRAHIMNNAASDSFDEFHKINVIGTMNLAEQAAMKGVMRFIFISSVGVNGNTNDRPFTEEDKPNPQGPYALSKFEAEQGLLKIARQSKMEVVIIRPPLVYAANAPGNFARLMGLVKWVARLHLPLPFGAINNRRSLVAVQNLIDFIVLCVDHPLAGNQTFLVADGVDVSTTELLRACAVEQGVNLRLIPVPQRWLEFGARLLGKQSLMMKLCGNLQVDITKARSLLGWNPVVPSVMAGLRKNPQDKV